MATENRSSNTENVRCPFCGGKVDPEGWLNGAGQRGPECEGCGATAPSLALWNAAQSAKQHQVQPIAVVDEGDDGLFVELIYGDDGNPLRRGDKLYNHPAPAVQGDPVAWRGINELGEVVTEWIDGVPPSSMTDLCGNPASFARIERAYTHADPAEVERLRAKIGQLRTALRGRQEQWSKLEIALLAQLAEAHALLADLGVEPEEVSDIYKSVLKDAERYRLLRDRMTVEDFPAEHPDCSTPSESESLRIDQLCDSALSPKL
ncbi:hypothetical protein [Pseudomonas cremoricolorata]|uniref:Uncharacterized protein n=1 Tax=Pseudomonas cremoricolorata TaxID=157783 RepID=A0A089WTG6_9PSED|nr:hypothetical protein [Pseudomonas cremoricolorata]AIR90479.1 hypothetical protein LK03_14805 [Pseudomonas cremoricolorata]